jgi:hypothetical protein
MSPIVKLLRANLAEGPRMTITPPVVRLQARFSNTWAAWGSGFFIGQWPSSIITARHVVALPQGISPADVRVEAFVGGTWSSLEAVAISFPAGGPAAHDVAIVRIQGSCTSSLKAATIDQPCRVEIWGYPLSAGRPAASPLVVGCRAQPSYGQIVAVSESGAPIAAVGIYLGTSPSGAKAHALIDDNLFASKDAALNATTNSRTPS